MSWNYRVMKEKSPIPGDDTEMFGVYEVFYDDAGKLNGYSTNPKHPYGESLEELKADYELMVEAFNKPVLEWKIED